MLGQQRKEENAGVSKSNKSLNGVSSTSVPGCGPDL